MFGPKIKIDQELYEKLGRCAEAAGYSSTDEFIRHALEKAVAAIDEADSEEEVKKRLQGLGYID
ncbi:MAG: ribbon-helix-helix protein, CopG family [Armatimonadetes bacterium]|nr:ribbon-helix-helix protein, CopG family [Armatimonadota bacterium]NIM24417.1 ribbon-helix-helix protein, CopG family [Armatimonadota bacterium]NIM68288.1 ribbon-helix-helix protein, CopG family [Armatimonadota bacterium]NIM76692.1 ribbon-helix-helix protein, CopG family [Armatimonadota bacterium]NIN06491.1 ribbon-helix-helix protein, CopG family [Armatimonadota bacterium]